MHLLRRGLYRLTVGFQLLLAIACTILVALAWTPAKAQFPWLPNWSTEKLLALLAISFAIVQFTDARRQERAMTVVAWSMSTRFIGVFPKNLMEITEVVSRASSSIYVIVDFVGYGHYSVPELHAKYFEALKSARIRGVDARIITYDGELGSKERLQQFPDAASMFAAKQDERAFNKYFEIHRGVGRPADNAELRRILAERDGHNRVELQNVGLQLKFLSEPEAFFLWLEDSEEAIFTFKNVGRRDRGLSFRTRDANLVRQFSEIFDRRWQAASSDFTPRS